MRLVVKVIEDVREYSHASQQLIRLLLSPSIIKKTLSRREIIEYSQVGSRLRHLTGEVCEPPGKVIVAFVCFNRRHKFCRVAESFQNLFTKVAN